MGIDLEWIDENGAQRQFISDAKGEFLSFILEAREFNTTVCLRFIDPFGNTMFNQRQLATLATELESKASSVRASDTAQQILRFARLVRTAEGKCHTYIRFVGD
jgi:hypothetical protein